MGGVYDIIMPGGRPDDSWRVYPHCPLLLMPARRPGVKILLQRAFSPRAGGNFLPLSDENMA